MLEVCLALSLYYEPWSRLKGESEIEVSVDTNISMENVKRNFEKNGYSVTTKEEEDFFIVTGKK